MESSCEINFEHLLNINRGSYIYESPMAALDLILNDFEMPSPRSIVVQALIWKKGRVILCYFGH